MSADNYVSDSDNDINDAVHSNLVSAVTQLEGKQRVKVSVRKEPSIEVSEFHLVKSGTGKKDSVNLHELAQALGKRASHSDLTDKLRLSKRQSKTLPKPLEKPEANRIDRSVRYENVKKQLRRWDAVVQTNRLSDNLSFPLKQPNLDLGKSKDFLKKFSPQTTLEIEINKVLSKDAAEDNGETEEDNEFPLSLEEMIQRRKEMARLRVLQSYEQTKACRQKKIKSKKYHRILKREKIKQQLKDFEVLKNTDPEAALKQLEELDKTRAEERASLRHRTTGQWAKSKAVRAKYDVESRKVLAQQLSMSRELTQKVQKEDDSSDDEENDITEVSSNPSNNPWVGPVKTDAEITDFLSRYRKYWSDQEKTRAEKDEAREVKVGQDEMCENGLDVSEEDGLSDGKVKSLIASVSLEKNGNRVTNDGSDVEEISNNGDGVSCNKPNVRKFVVHTKKPSESLSTSSNIAPHKDNTTGVKIAEKCKFSTLNNTNKSSKKRKREAKATQATVKVAAASGTWVVTSDQESNAARTNLKKKKRVQVDVDIDDLFDDIDKKFKINVNKKIKNMKAKLNINDGNFVVDDHDTNETDDLGASLAFKKSVQRPVLDEELIEGTERLPTPFEALKSTVAVTDLGSNNSGAGSMSKDMVFEKQTGQDIDPNKFMTLKPKHLKTQLPDIITAGDEAMDDDEDRHMTITEAFADDDVVAEFRKEKDNTVKETKPEKVSLAMPGWGQWGGKNIVVSKRKKKRFMVTRPAMQQRKDSTMGDVIINEEKDKKLREHMVNALPFPFTSVKSFEASIRAPIGNTWIPQSSHVKLTEPRVRTKLGSIIRPMDEESLLKKNSRPKTLRSK